MNLSLIFFRSKAQGKKLHGLILKSFYYLIKVRFLDNSTNLSFFILYLYGLCGLTFWYGSWKHTFYHNIFYFSSILGIHFKILTSTVIFLFIIDHYLEGNGTTLVAILFFLLGIFARNQKNILQYSKFMI